MFNALKYERLSLLNIDHLLVHLPPNGNILFVQGWVVKYLY